MSPITKPSGSSSDDPLGSLKGCDAVYVLNEIDRLAARLGHRPEPCEVVYQARIRPRRCVASSGLNSASRSPNRGQIERVRNDPENAGARDRYSRTVLATIR